ncbi:MAG: hypothetical protein CM1200mP16_11520 [Nitrospina sp.]|nr:MAG: hypothetical protein CM1200mP16_11520 [Nitrospina sp.]
MAIQFTKMSGSGTILSSSTTENQFLTTLRKSISSSVFCDRKMSVGADGVFFFRKFRKKLISNGFFYNDDGSSAEMCGNGGRCVARYAAEKKITSNELTLKNLWGGNLLRQK